MLEEDALLTPILRRHFHEEIQEVVQNGMREIIAKVAKSHKPKKKPVKEYPFSTLSTSLHINGQSILCSVLAFTYLLSFS
jgi:hypothetical protein